MENYYKILGISQNATAAEIKRAYRKKAKQFHPDATHREADAAAFREVVRAYEVLSDLKQKSIFDESFSIRQGFSRKKAREFNYREWLLEREDEESRSKLIFFDLMHNKEDEAVAEFKRMNMNFPHFSLTKWFTREDFMDYGFILAEELVIRQEYYDAVLLLEQIIRMEYSFNYFRFFFPEVLDLARNVLRNHLDGKINDELALDAWERALDLRLGKKDDAFFLQKMSLAYRRIGDEKTAAVCLEEASKLLQSVK
ncbi:MAG: DnaJ domain-containing protein [Spirochaetaceae bacterium]|nr:DnaJ domain-containing protein [Spirochaetaceae bacterium]